MWVWHVCQRGSDMDVRHKKNRYDKGARPKKNGSGIGARPMMLGSDMVVRHT
jgi:hypothetical protein